MSTVELTLDLGELIGERDCRVDYDVEIDCNPCINKVEVRAVKINTDQTKTVYWMDISDLIQNDELLLKQVEEFIND